MSDLEKLAKHEDERRKEEWQEKLEQEKKALTVEHPVNWGHWPPMWRSIFNDGVEAAMKALPPVPTVEELERVFADGVDGELRQSMEYQRRDGFKAINRYLTERMEDKYD